MGQFYKCSLCNHADEELEISHKDSERHRLNVLLSVRETFRTKHLQISDVVISIQNLNMLHNIQASYDDLCGIYLTKMQSCTFQNNNKMLQVKFFMKNKQKGQVYIRVEKLYKLNSFYIAEKKADNSNEKHHFIDYLLNPEEECTYFVTYMPATISIGTFTLPVAITVQPVKNQIAQKTVFRDIIVTIRDEVEEEDEVSEDSPYKKVKWEDVTIIPPVKGPKHIAFFKLDCFSKVYMSGFKEFNGETFQEKQFRLQSCTLIERGKNQLTKTDYAPFYHKLLWLEEAVAAVGLLQYNMSAVTVEILRKNVLLKVPGLAEKRPSVMRGDFVTLRVLNDHTGYSGVVSTLQEDSIIIEHLEPVFLLILEQTPGIQLDVQFNLSRLQLERMHMGVQMCANREKFVFLFPEAPQRISVPARLTELINKNISQNVQQLIAVESIVSKSSGKAPYIIYGPPGTGKTVTLVEAILQIMRTRPDERILVCAPSNAACDMLAGKLMPHCDNSDILRLHTGSRNINDIPTDIRYISNLDGLDFYMVPSKDLISRKLVISTLHLIGHPSFRETYKPDVLFIDEAAQAMEPECDIAIGLLNPLGQVVLAGDPQQLGPVCSYTSCNMGLGRSLMSRLMDTNNLYASYGRRVLEYDNNYITMLKKNYRSYEDIIMVPNKICYQNTLETIAHDDPISRLSIGRMLFKQKKGEKIPGAAIEFYNIVAKEQRNGRSPSFYNSTEIEMVVKVVKKLLDLSDVLITPAEIGIIAPYIRQVYKIRQRLEALNLNDIQVGTTEAFQGGERRIIIISTVRGQTDLLLYDKKYDLGFVKHKNRFNVAITRAQAKLIIIGNAYVLDTDHECWGSIIDQCQELNSFFGGEYRPRDEEQRMQLVRQLAFMESK